jgi:hypothetical protein
MNYGYVGYQNGWEILYAARREPSVCVREARALACRISWRSPSWRPSLPLHHYRGRFPFISCTLRPPPEPLLCVWLVHSRTLHASMAYPLWHGIPESLIRLWTTGHKHYFCYGEVWTTPRIDEGRYNLMCTGILACVIDPLK